MSTSATLPRRASELRVRAQSPSGKFRVMVSAEGTWRGCGPDVTLGEASRQVGTLSDNACTSGGALRINGGGESEAR